MNANIPPDPNGKSDVSRTPCDLTRAARAGGFEDDIELGQEVARRLHAIQHPRNEFCFYCAPDDMLLRGISLHDEGKPWDGPTVHMQVPESFCPAMTEEDS